MAMIASLLGTAAIMNTAPLPELKVQGKHLVNPQGQPVTLKGVNVGNWFVIEPWMLGLGDNKGGFEDQYSLEETLTQRFGASEKDRLMNLYRSNWITEKDFAEIKDFGFNLVRIPLNYRQFEDDTAPYKLRPDAFKWTDLAIEWATKNNIYVILDMHGAQGGQSPYDHTGRVNQNKLWTEPENQKRLAWLWTEIANKYKSNTTVIAYDLYNEPYGGTHETQVKLFNDLYPQVRKVDPEKLILAHGHYDTFTHYGDPKTNGWHNVGFQMHYYPGMFGNGDPTPLTHARHIQNLAGTAKIVDKLNVPFLIGEMNVVFEAAGGGPLMRRYFDLHASYGWMTTMWSYKTISPEGGHGDVSWAMVTNKNPYPTFNAQTSSKQAIESYFRGLRTMEIQPYTQLKSALTAKVAPPVNLPKLPDPILTAPDTDALPNYTISDINNPLPGGLTVKSSTQFDLFGGGQDIWGSSDQFRFLHRQVTGDFTLTVTIVSLDDVASYSKAGLMARESLRPNSPHVMLTTFPSAELQNAWRPQPSSDTQAHEGVKTQFPITIRLKRIGNNIIAAYKTAQDWQIIGQAPAPNTQTLHIGPLALSNNNSRLAKATYQNLTLTQP